MTRVDETWHRLLRWTQGQAPSERLVAQILNSDGFEAVDPSHPLGGKDGGKDAIVLRHGERWIMAAYFPRDQQPFSEIQKKLLADSRGVKANDAHGMAFVTNQELRLRKRETLQELVDHPLEIYHLERISTILDQPAMASVRKQFLDIGDDAAEIMARIATHHERLEALQTGGDTFCCLMLYDFDMNASMAQNFVLIRKGQFPLYDLRSRICDLDTGQDVSNQAWGEMNAPAMFTTPRWPLRPSLYYRIWFNARNGQWTQDLQLRRSDEAECWLAATRVKARNGDVRFSHIDTGYEEEFGEPQCGHEEPRASTTYTLRAPCQHALAMRRVRTPRLCDQLTGSGRPRIWREEQVAGEGRAYTCLRARAGIRRWTAPAWPPMSVSSSAPGCRRRRNRDCVASASLAFPRPALGPLGGSHRCQGRHMPTERSLDGGGGHPHATRPPPRRS